METVLPNPNVASLVLDTNVVLDWLVFGDAGVASLAGVVEAGRLRWLSCPRMRSELERTLRYVALKRWNPDSVRTLTCFDRLAVPCQTPPPCPAHPVCTDPDDQVFLDLALIHGARWLVTRDRALLKLARRTGGSGLRIVTPTQWALDWAAENERAARAALS